jgi:hypothetical protein
MVMETAIVWGWLLTMQTANMPPIIDVNYKTEEACELVKSELVPLYPNYTIYCTPTWKPEEVKKAKARKKVTTRKRTTATRTTRRR